MNKLHTENLPGNLHQVATIINKRGWADYVIHMDFNGGNYTVVVFRMPEKYVHEVRLRDAAYSSDPHHDDVLTRW